MVHKESFFKRTARMAALAAAALLIMTGTCRAVINDPGILNNQGVELFERGYVVAAIEKFQQALEFSPNNSSVHANLGYAYQALNNHEEAVREFKRALSNNPTDLETHNNLGVSLYNLGMVDRAVEEWRYILSNDPTHAAASANLAMVRNPAIADRISLEAQDARLSPVQRKLKQQKNLEKTFENGKTAYLEGRYDDAVDYLTNVLNEKPSSKYSHYYLGMSYAYLNMESSAMRHIREYLILESYPPESEKVYERATTVFDKLKKGYVLAPRGTTVSSKMSAVFEQGKEAYMQKDYFKAINVLSRVYKAKPESYQTNYYLGLAYRQVGDTNRAVFHLTKCLLAGPEKRTKEEAVRIANIVKELTDR